MHVIGTAGHVDGIPELCVPDLVLSDAGSGVAGLQVAATVFPSGVAQASTWDPAVQRRLGRAIGEEASAKGINVMLGPGMNIARINMSHGSHKSALMIVRRIQSLNRTLNHPVAILLDTMGPEIRTGELKTNIDLKVGEIFSFTVLTNENPEEKSVHVNYQDMVKDLKVGTQRA